MNETVVLGEVWLGFLFGELSSVSAETFNSNLTNNSAKSLTFLNIDVSNTES